MGEKLAADEKEQIITGTIFDIQRFTVHDGPGIRTAIFMKGCPLRCPWCQNPESMQKNPQISYFPTLCIGCGSCETLCPHNAVNASGEKLSDKIKLAICNHCGKCTKECYSGALRLTGQRMSVEEVYNTVMKDEQFYQDSGGGVTFTGGEPTYQPEFLTAMAKKLKKADVHLVIETCGMFSWDSAAEAFSLMDIIYMDIKHADSEKHRTVIGQSNDSILENALHIDKLMKPIRIRVPLIPGFNDSIEDFSATLKFAACLNNLEKVQILPYHKFGIAKYDRIGLEYSLTHVEPPPNQIVDDLLALAKRHKIPCSL
jgi:pyruvate formate lyase activating enzyme